MGIALRAFGVAFRIMQNKVRRMTTSNQASNTARYIHPIAKNENTLFAQNIFGRHLNLSKTLKSFHERKVRDGGVSYANNQLRKFHEGLIAHGTSLSAAMEDFSIKDVAKVKARWCLMLGRKSSGEIDVLVRSIAPYVESHGLTWPASIRKSDSEADKREKHAQAIARSTCERWWLRQLRTNFGRQVEGQLRKSGFVNTRKSPYVSKWALQRFLHSQARNQATLEGLEIECSETGETLELNQAIEASVSNPENRRNELMTRMRGWEEIAQTLGLTGLFFTLTAPSKYHAVGYTGQPNPKFNGSTPRDTMTYLNGAWARIRAEWKRKEIKALGFRVAEPHSDGTPHFHFLLFFNPQDIETAKSVFGSHALAEDGDEPGAQENRWDCISIDPSKGTAAGYIAKYISKNIDGHAIDWDYEGECPADQGAVLVQAWSSLWGIRQFQQIGNASVTVWRELRRLREPLADWQPEEAEALRQAADDGDWATFVTLMGGNKGAFAGRDEQMLRALNVQKPEPNRYREYISKIIGLTMRGAARQVIITREKIWRVQIKGTAESRGLIRAASPPALDLCQ